MGECYNSVGADVGEGEGLRLQRHRNGEQWVGECHNCVGAAARGRSAAGEGARRHTTSTHHRGMGCETFEAFATSVL